MAFVLIGQFAFADDGRKEALRLAINDIKDANPGKYSNADEYLRRLDAVTNDADFAVLQREALLANPLLDFEKLLVIKRSREEMGLPNNWDSNCALSPDGYDNEIALLSLRKGAVEKVYKPENGLFAGDVDLDYDSGKILFSMPNKNKRWHVWEMKLDPATGLMADGSALRQVTSDEEHVDQYDPCYLPDGKIIFASTASFIGVPCVDGSSSIANLYRMDSDGSNIRQLCFDQENDWCPTVLSDGRVMYLRWEYSDLPHANSRRMFRMNPDGTDQRLYYGTDSYFPPSLFYARPIPGHQSKIVGIVTGHHGVPRAGRLMIFDPAISRKDTEGVVHEIPHRGKTADMIVRDRIVDGVWPQFLHPYPLSEKYFLVSCRPSPEDDWGVYLVDVFDNMLKICDQPGYCIFEPVPFRKIVKPPVVPDTVDLKSSKATVLLTDIYKGRGLPGIPKGTVKSLRVVQYYFSWRGMGGTLGAIGMDGPWDIKRVLGTVPVESDGSAYFEIPAQMPVMVQPLDDKGQAMQVMRSWFTGMPGERMSCVGCHENLNESPPAVLPLASKRAPSKIEPWFGQPRGFNFAREVQPVLDRNCIGCHGDGKLAREYELLKPGETHKPYLKGDIMLKGWDSQIAGSAGHVGGKFSVSYAELHRYVRRPGIEGDMRTLSPMDYHFSSTELGQMLLKGHHGVVLDAESISRLSTWADLNAPYHGTWSEIKGANVVRTMVDLAAAARRKYAFSGPAYEYETIPVIEERKTDLKSEPAVEERKTDLKSENLNFKSLTAGEAAALQKECAAKTSAGEITKKVDLGGGMTLEMVLVPGGRFLMGSSTGHSDETPSSIIEIKPFWVGKFEVSNAQFRRYDPMHDSRDESRHGYQFGQRGYDMNTDSQPAVRLSWEKAMAYCRWLSEKTGKRFTLPDEAQWEYACRAGAQTPYSFGVSGSDYSAYANLGDVTLKEFASCTWMAGAVNGSQIIANANKYDDWIPRDTRYDDKGFVSTKVGSYKPNPWGLHDMHGNVWEWTLSSYRPYPFRADDGRNDAGSAGKRTARGGSWYDRPFKAASSYRLAYESYQPVFNVGFRIASDKL